MKRIFYTEISYFLGLVIMAFAAALTELAEFGMSMIVAPTYILHLQVSKFLPWFSFGVSEYIVQGLVLILTAAIMKRFKLSYLFSFVTALIYGAALDLAMVIVSYIPSDGMVVRLICFVSGMFLCAVAVSLFFHTYIAPEAYELIVKELSKKFSININKFKTLYDCISASVSIILSFAFFGFGVFKGIGIGTIICALLNGFLIGKTSAFLEKHFEFVNGLPLEKYFM